MDKASFPVAQKQTLVACCTLAPLKHSPVNGFRAFIKMFGSFLVLSNFQGGCLLRIDKQSSGL